MGRDQMPERRTSFGCYKVIEAMDGKRVVVRV